MEKKPPSVTKPISKSTTKLDYNKVSCYFCNEWLDNDNFKDHIIHCGQVLEKCPNACTSYIQRKQMNLHLTECPKTKNSHGNEINVNVYEKCLNNLENDIDAIRKALHAEIKERLHLITDISKLKKHNQIADSWTNKVGDVLTSLKKCLNEETNSRCVDVKKCREDILKINEDNHVIEDWRVEFSMRLDNICSELVKEDNLSGRLDVLMNDNQNIKEKINCLETELTLIKENYENEINNPNSTNKLILFDKLLLEQKNNYEKFNIDLIKQINSIKSEIDNKKSIETDFITKLMTIDYELKGMKHIVYETEDKCDKLNKLVDNLKLITTSLKEKYNDFNEHILYEKKFMNVINTRGNLIWRIGHYNEKLRDAKENDSTLRSPLFSNRQYGYTLRLDVNLNGIGTWKGRNLIACLTVVDGEFDTLLPWPCKLKADIILRDQNTNLNEAKDFYKTIIVKKINKEHIDNSNNCENEKNIYIHISHNTISSCNYIKNNAIFLEVRVHTRNNK